MAVSPTDIANLALGHIGAPPIMDLDDRDNKSAREVKRVFDSSIAAVGRMHTWNCLKQRTQAAQLTIKPIFGWAEQYQLPSDYLKMVSLNDKDREDFSDLWEIEGDKLLTDETEANIRYIAHLTNTVLYDPNFVDCVAMFIAQRIATPIRQDRTKAAELKQEFFERILPDARKTDANEQRQGPINTTAGSGYIKSRRISTAG